GRHGLIRPMGPSKGLHLLVRRPAQLQRDVNAPLTVVLTITGVQRDPGRSRIAYDGDSLRTALELSHLVNIGAIHRDFVGSPLDVARGSRFGIAYQPALPPGQLGHGIRAEVVDDLVERVFRKT